MATNGIAGFRSKLRVSADGNTFYTVAELTSLGKGRQGGVIKANHHDEQSYDSNLPGRISATITAAANYVPGDPGQELVETIQATPGSFIYFKMLAHWTIGAPMTTGRGVVTDSSVAFGDEQAASRTINITVDGALAGGFAAAGDLA